MAEVEYWARKLGWPLTILIIVVVLTAVLLVIDITSLPGVLQPFVQQIFNRVSILWGAISANYALALVSTALVLYFPLAVFAYGKYEAPTRIRRLHEDFRLLFGKSHQLDGNEYLSGFFLGNFFWHVALAMFVTFIGCWLLLKAPDTLNGVAVESTVQAMRYGFLGAYLFSAQLIYRRYTTQDLQPGVFMYCSLTLIAGLVFNYVAFESITDVAATQGARATGVTAGFSAIAAFSLGYFPALAITWFNRLAVAGLGVEGRQSNEKPLSLVQGISQFHEARLRDNGIDNVQNLATADIASLLRNTTFSAQEVIDWIDQAILALYIDEGSLPHFRQAGIRSLSDFRKAWKATSKEQATVLAQELKTTPGRLQVLAAATEIGPNVHHVAHYWEEVEKVTAQRREIDKIAMRRKLQELGEDPWLDTRRGGGLGRRLDPDVEQYIEEAHLDSDEEVLDTPEQLLGLAYSAHSAGKLDKAVQLYKGVLDKDPDNVFALTNLANLYLQQEQQDSSMIQELVDKGLAVAEKDTTVPPEFHASLYLAKAKLKTNEGDFTGARSVLEAGKKIKDLPQQILETLTDYQQACAEEEEAEADKSDSDGGPRQA